MLNSPCSSPPRSTSPSSRARFPLLVETIWFSNGQPNWLMMGSSPASLRCSATSPVKVVNRTGGATHQEGGGCDDQGGA